MWEIKAMITENHINKTYMYSKHRNDPWGTYSFCIWWLQVVIITLVLTLTLNLLFLEAAVPRCSVKKVLLKIFAKFTGKHLCQSPATLLKKRLWHRCFPVNYVKFLRTPFLTEHLQWLLLYFHHRMSLITQFAPKTVSY